jgi:hypothetical protein
VPLIDGAEGRATGLEEGSDGDPVSVLVVEERWPKRPLAT